MQNGRKYKLLSLIDQLLGDRKGVVAIYFALTMIPIVMAMGAAIDFSRASLAKTKLQGALDAAVLAGANDGSDNWANVARNTFDADIVTTDEATRNLTVKKLTSEQYSASASMSVPTTLMDIFNVPFINVKVTATVIGAKPDTSCILTLDHGQPSSHVSLALNGAPVVNLAGCGIRSNTSINCNGHDGDTPGSSAGGSATYCSHPEPGAPAVPDIYAGLAGNITHQCGTSRPGATWEVGTAPSGPGVIEVSQDGYTEYHICGDLTLSGSGYLTGVSPDSGTVIVVENGNLIVSKNANVSASKTAIVLTGDGAYSSKIEFPTGNGQSATLSLSAPTDVSNPWQGVALYQDPALTYQVDDSWGPGATFNANGLVYLGNANVVTDGNTGSSNSECSKFVTNSFTTNGSASLNLNQNASDCSAIGLKQWNGIVVHLTG